MLDTASAEFLRDPHAVYDRLRCRDLVEDPLGLSTISYAASEEAFHDTALVPAIDHLLEDLGIGALWGSADHTLTNTEGADHRRLRRALTPWFTPKRVAQLRTRTAALVGSLLELHAPGAPFDVMTGMADVVPARVFGWMLGVDGRDDVLFTEWSKALILVFTAQPSMVGPVREAKAEIAQYCVELLAHKRRHPADDLATMLATAEDRGEISGADAIGLLDELLSAAVDNTANTTGCALAALASHPDAWRRAHAGADVPTMVEELGRFEPAIRHTIKYAVRDTELAGRAIGRGEFVTVRVAAAHRDPTAFPDPHVLDVTRPPARPQLAFGAGRHHCLGAALARVEVQEMVAGVTRRFAEVAIGPDAHMEIPANGHVYRLPLEVA